MTDDNSHSDFPSTLQNQFLVAMPQMLDPYFANTVTYLWRHNEEGALGIVINKPLQACVADIFGELNIECSLNDERFTQQHVLLGEAFIIERAFDVEFAKDIGHASLQGLVDDNAQRAFFVVAPQVGDRIGEIGVQHLRHGDEELVL